MLAVVKTDSLNFYQLPTRFTEVKTDYYDFNTRFALVKWTV